MFKLIKIVQFFVYSFKNVVLLYDGFHTIFIWILMLI